jgi:hypothetical protein
MTLHPPKRLPSTLGSTSRFNIKEYLAEYSDYAVALSSTGEVGLTWNPDPLKRPHGSPHIPAISNGLFFPIRLLSWPLVKKLYMRTFNPWVGSLYRNEGIGGKRLLILGESHYGGPACDYPTFTTEIIEEMALQKGRLPFFARIQRLVVGGRGVFSDEERNDFWQRVAFYNYIQTALEVLGDRPTGEMWQSAQSAFIETLNELSPDIVLVLGIELRRNMPAISNGITYCEIQHPSAIGFSYDRWQPIVRKALGGMLN